MLSNQGTVSEEYIQLCFMVDALVKEAKGKDFVVIDSYFGPPDFKHKDKTPNPDELLKSLHTFRARIRKEIHEEPHRTFLTKQLDAIVLLVRYALDDNVTFEERVRTGLDVEVVTVSSERIEELAEQANRALRKKVLKGDLTSMAARWRKQAMTTGSEIIPIAQEIAMDARRSTQRVLFELPETESVEFRAVPDAPWSAYNYYQGDFKAVIEINTQLPRSKYGIWKWVTHEAYPGHQTQLVQRELGYQQDTQNLEATIALINTPDCTIVEGLAETGPNILSSDRPPTEAETITSYITQLRRAVGVNALVMLQQQQKNESEVLGYIKELGAYEEAYAKAQLPFMIDPIWGPYGFTYFVGAWLVKGFFKAAQEANLLDEFINALYYELHTPSTLKTRIKDLDLKLPNQLI
ncbi:MAG: hypothetical protein Q6364_08485 [Candidatus Hermodarchaeota archaeon]|nr:hypothetical protein [Candidatus Hermodarchaeota archaeon]